MKEQFEYGELVEVRDYDNEEWKMYNYVGTMPNCRQHFTMRHMQDVTNFDGIALGWNQIRKIKDDEEILDKLFEFETYASARFDSEVRVALAVYEYVKQMKQMKSQIVMSRCSTRKLADNEVAILDYNTREMDVITIENLGEIMEELDEDKYHATEQALRDLGYDLYNIDFMT